MFRTFEPYILVVAGVAVVSSILWLAFSRSRLLKVVCALLILGGITSAYAHFGVSLRLQQMSPSTPEWKSLHGRSMMLYAAQAGLLAIGGLLLPATLAQQQKLRVDQHAA